METSDTLKDIERAEALSFTKIPPMRLWEAVLLSGLMAALDALEFNVHRLPQALFFITELIIVIAAGGFLYYRTYKINRNYPKMWRAPAEIKKAVAVFFGLFIVFVAPCVVCAPLIPHPWGWLTVPYVFVAMMATMYIYKHLYIKGALQVKRRLS